MAPEKGLIFSFQDMLTEISAMAELASNFITPLAYQTLKQLGVELQGIQTAPSQSVCQWGVREGFPLTTIVSEGGYQPDENGYHNVFAEITSIWEIRRIKPQKKSMPAMQFELVGKTSTRVRLVEVVADRRNELAMWRFEAGDIRAPGCHFHIQVLGESDDAPFPHSLDIPRLPSLLLTPPAVLEYVLNELFQDRWVKHITQTSAHLNRWAPIQRDRLLSLLRWQHDLVHDCSGSPWPMLKNAKPDPKLFSPAHESWRMSAQ